MGFPIAAAAGALIAALLVIGLTGFWWQSRREGHDVERTGRTKPEGFSEDTPRGDSPYRADEPEDDDDTLAPGPGMHDFIA